VADQEPRPATPRGVVALLERRLGRFRRLVLAIGLVALAAAVCALVFWAWQPLLGLLLAVPLVALFLVADAVAVRRWHAAVLAEWAAGRLPLDGFRDTLAAVKQLPTATILGLFDPLPTNARLGVTKLPPEAVREALAATTLALARRQIRLIIAAGVALTGVVAAVAAAALAASWYPLLAVPVVLLFVRITRWQSGRPPRGWADRIRDLRAGGLDVAAFAELARKLDWSALPAGAAERWLAVVLTPEPVPR
jgi:hypothetical protein